MALIELIKDIYDAVDSGQAAQITEREIYLGVPQGLIHGSFDLFNSQHGIVNSLVHKAAVVAYTKRSRLTFTPHIKNKTINRLRPCGPAGKWSESRGD